MQHKSEHQQPALLLRAEVDIPNGWISIAHQVASELSELRLPTDFRIEKISRLDQYMYVSCNAECLGESDSELHQRVFKIINGCCDKATASCMACGKPGKTLFETERWGVYCDQHIPHNALDLYARFESIEAECLDRSALHAEFPCLPALELRPGWLPLIKFLMNELKAAGFDSQNYRILQVKEKFALLAFYVYSDDPDSKRQKLIHALIDAARNRSATMCEACGEKASMWIHAGWWTTACAKHVPEGAMTPAEYFRKSHH